MNNDVCIQSIIGVHIEKINTAAQLHIATDNPNMTGNIIIKRIIVDIRFIRCPDLTTFLNTFLAKYPGKKNP